MIRMILSAQKIHKQQISILEGYWDPLVSLGLPPLPMVAAHIGKGLQELEPSCIADGNVKSRAHCEDSWAVF